MSKTERTEERIGIVVEKIFITLPIYLYQTAKVAFIRLMSLP